MRAETKATRIPDAVKRAVWARDNGRCIVCGRAGSPWCHFIPRSHGGLGIEQNIVTLCHDCHRRFDQSAERASMKAYLAAYLKGCYPEWDESKLIYRKGMDYA